MPNLGYGPHSKRLPPMDLIPMGAERSAGGGVIKERSHVQNAAPRPKDTVG